MKILVGDDSILARKQLTDHLNKLLDDITIVEATNGREAVAVYKAEKPDIVFLDIVMPISDGVTSLKEILQFDSEAKIIIVSSVGTQSELKEAIEAGAKDFIQKPIKEEHIENVIRNYL